MKNSRNAHKVLAIRILIYESLIGKWRVLEKKARIRRGVSFDKGRDGKRRDCAIDRLEVLLWRWPVNVKRR